MCWATRGKRPCSWSWYISAGAITLEQLNTDCADILSSLPRRETGPQVPTAHSRSHREHDQLLPFLRPWGTRTGCRGHCAAPHADLQLPVWGLHPSGAMSTSSIPASSPGLCKCSPLRTCRRPAGAPISGAVQRGKGAGRSWKEHSAAGVSTRQDRRPPEATAWCVQPGAGVTCCWPVELRVTCGAGSAAWRSPFPRGRSWVQREERNRDQSLQAPRLCSS